MLATLNTYRAAIVGCGRNGSRMVRYCDAFDATPAYYDRYVDSRGVPSWSLDRIFADSDTVVVCRTLTPKPTE